MKSKQQVAQDFFKEMASLGFPHDQNMVSMFIEGMRQQEVISKQQTAELQQEVERLKKLVKAYESIFGKLNIY